MLADTSVFEFLALDWLQGNPDTALAEPDTIVVTRSFARRYFGDAEPYGQTLLMGGERQTPLRVTGVVEDLPYNMHLATGAFLALGANPIPARPDILQDWNFANFSTYIKLAPGVDFARLETAFYSFLLDNMPEAMRADWQFSALRLPEIHLHSPLPGLGGRSSGNLAKVRVLGLIATGLLLLAGINFVNLSTARAMQRSKEIVIRKAVGSSRAQLVQQFLGESLLLVVAAFLMALALAELALPAVNVFTGKDMTLSVLFASLPALALVIALGTVFGSF